MAACHSSSVSGSFSGSEEVSSAVSAAVSVVSAGASAGESADCPPAPQAASPTEQSVAAVSTESVLFIMFIKVMVSSFRERV